MPEPLRANSPVNNDFGVLNLPGEDDELSPVQKLTKEHLELAKAAKSANGKIILDHLQKRVDTFSSQLKSQDLVSIDPTTALARVMAAQLVIQEFEAVLNDAALAVKTVEDAVKQS
jgi:hypothetical protein